MVIRIFDVAHGFCAYVVSDNGNTMLLDCGHNDETQFYPADYLLAANSSGIERFFVLNYDEDHLSGLPRLRQLENRIPIRVLNRNVSITGDQLRTLKRQSGPLGPGMVSLLSMIDTYTAVVTSPPLYTSLDYAVFSNDYPAFQDTNNLSLVLFLHFPGLSIVFPGDLEVAGWKALLQQLVFRQHLAKVNIFVASHHGRKSGYAEEVFQLCKPDVVIISDESKQFATQDVDYAQHAKGITWNQTEIRKVLTTRNDGMLTITSRLDTGYHIQASK
jgi:beta-lactamase superfamily II metal-dependent hydrolase